MYLEDRNLDLEERLENQLNSFLVLIGHAPSLH
jgi:hypothetical protein